MLISKNHKKTFSFDDSLGSFILLTAILIFTLLISILTFILHLEIIKSMFSYISFLLIILTAITLFSLTTVFILTVYIYRTKHTNSILLFAAKIELNFLLPLLIAFSGLFKNYNNNIRIFYITLNNIVVNSVNKKYTPEKILILLPHCLQNSSCSFKITNNISNCQKCNNCTIGKIKEIGEKYKVATIEVASGGMAARNVVQRIKPKLIIAIACERDLASGIADVKNIPVIGILNQRPNGPCMNTSMHIEELAKALENVADLGCSQES